MYKQAWTKANKDDMEDDVDGIKDKFEDDLDMASSIIYKWRTNGKGDKT